ncbi:response regulator receiver [Thioalkalivibrio nitratireducens DSM 14787]|uniref:Response regulator receiver n=1 Tax=Thioalkalivibrio nitratireducens (strain DSM 14787 / UNIQEM 213 / ALEN2) TaxID=1255043 RepID=L0DYU4_THIND|nr:response regulator receiver [Thioalkalivibrio nitratireducens DSM 14787]
MVDDDPGVVEELVDWFRSQGLQARGACDTDEAAALIARDPGLRIVYCDVAMPGTSGPEWILERQRGTGLPGSLVFVLYTGLGPGYLRMFEEMDGVAAVLRKPFTEEALAASLACAVRACHPAGSGRADASKQPVDGAEEWDSAGRRNR